MPPLAENPLFFLDYDGTLAPIVDDPMQAHPHPDVPALLKKLEARHPIWIVTGRHLRDLDALLGMPLEGIGLHGAHEGTIGTEPKSLMGEETRTALQKLRETAPALDGLRLEEKGEMFAVHYRAAEDKNAAREAIQAWTADLPSGLDAIWGKDVVELRATGLDKGAATTRIAEAHPQHTPVYLGDDTTDEDAFRALNELSDEAVTIKVGGGKTAARHRLGGPEDVVDYLKRYV